MIEDHWQRIAGIHKKPNGEIAAVWLARDPDTDVVRVYDACLFKKEVLAVIAEGLNARGRWVPISWKDKELAAALDERGCNMSPRS